eukprot:2808074-Prorocentrum_lima.AAC.1
MEVDSGAVPWDTFCRPNCPFCFLNMQPPSYLSWKLPLPVSDPRNGPMWVPASDSGLPDAFASTTATSWPVAPGTPPGKVAGPSL